ncbi:MAG: aryl-sulfate sulfotransferase [Actinomycetota bacterium]
MLIYDNGTDRLGTTLAGGDEAPFSRAVIYEVVPPTAPGERGTARQVWEHRVDGPDGVPEYAAFLGDADLVGDDHILITHGAMEDPAADGNYRARIIEVDRVSGDVVLDINLPAGDIGWRSYRAEHLDTLYP